MHRNKFKYSGLLNDALLNNGPHQLALRHTMMLYKHSVLFTFIPKVACSTMRLSVAIENGCIKDATQGNWIHKNNQTFNASLAECINAKYTFVIMRCPFRRLASVFLDKIVSKDPLAWSYQINRHRSFNLNDLTFREFVLSLDTPAIINSDIHWRPQSHFMIYDNYDDYFCLEQFSVAIQTLKERIGLSIHDARTLTGHGTDQYEMVRGSCIADKAAFDIAVMQRSGKCPDYKSMFDDELITIVMKLYKNDFILYKEKFKSENLLFKVE
jgi:hypothetical protein